MPEMVIDIPIKDVAQIISKMSSRELETLTLLLAEEGKDLLKRNEDLKSGKVQYLSEDEAFDV